MRGVLAGTTTITYSVTSGSGCVGYSVHTFTVYPTPVVAAITGVFSICTGTTTTLADATTGGAWTSSNTSVATAVSGTGVITGVALGTSNITYTVTNGSGCSGYALHTVTVVTTPTVAAITGTLSVCVGANTTLADASLGGVWTSSNTAKATVNSSGVVHGVAAGTTTITYTVTSGGSCTAYAVATVTVNAVPTVASISGTFVLCGGLTTTLTDATGGGVWSSSNTAVASISSGGVVTAGTNGTATISYTVTNGAGCSTSATHGFTVNATPVISAPGGTFSVCAPGSFVGGLITWLTASPTAGTWSSSNYSIASIIDHNGIDSAWVTGVAAGTVNISYTKNGCTGIHSFTVNGLPNVGVVSSLSRTSATFGGFSYTDFYFTGSPAGGTGYWVSTFPARGDFTAAAVPLVTGSGAAGGGLSYVYYYYVISATGCMEWTGQWGVTFHF